MASGPGTQVAVGRGLSQAFAEIQSWVAPVPEPVLGLGLLLLAAGFVFATLTDHRGHRTGHRTGRRRPGDSLVPVDATTPGKDRCHE